MIQLRLVLLILGLLAFAAAAIEVQTRFNLIATGLFLWLLTVILA